MNDLFVSLSKTLFSLVFLYTWKRITFTRCSVLTAIKFLRREQVVDAWPAWYAAVSAQREESLNIRFKIRLLECDFYRQHRKKKP